MDYEMESAPKKLRLDPITTRSQLSAHVRCFDLKPLEQFSGIQLPTNSDVIRIFFSIRDKFKLKTRRDISEIIFDELQLVWAKIPCPLIRSEVALIK